MQKHHSVTIYAHWLSGFVLHVNSDTLFSILVLSICFTWPKYLIHFSCNLVKKLWFKFLLRKC